jgi:hypothetical protein
MNIQYKIISLNEKTNSIQVNYLAEGIDRPFIYQYDLPVNTATNTTLTLPELDAYIMEFAPRQQMQHYLSRTDAVSSLDLSHISALVEPLIPGPTSAGVSSVQPVSTGTNTF